MSQEIPLPNGAVALVDDKDYERVMAYRWKLAPFRYAWTSIHSQNVYLHRLILQVLPGFVLDHINGNQLDNRRANLRACTQGENSANRRRNKNSRSGFKGVTRRENGTWGAGLDTPKRHINLGAFETAEDAARAYDAKAREVHGAFARLNFPRRGEQAA